MPRAKEIISRTILSTRAIGSQPWPSHYTDWAIPHPSFVEIPHAVSETEYVAVKGKEHAAG